MIRLLLADEHELFRCGMRMLLEAEPDLQVVGEAETGARVIQLARSTTADVALVDIVMQGVGGIEVTRHVRSLRPETQVLVVSGLEDPCFVRAALAAGARGYISKSSPPRALIDGVRSVSRGRAWICVPVDDCGLRGMVYPDEEPLTRVPRASQMRLSERERQVLELVAYGFTAREIAGQLDVGIKTVESYRARVAGKLGLRTRADVVRYALGTGLFDKSKLLPGRAVTRGSRP